ncbi:hypothetical protein GN244_ATG09668 [Phytophthora infestans]|uniref:Uncharacterized protein n=1 Tax=Phytophthora infestans TaxID=4787 RepID=A0A833W0V6_PHYIN|nr:hypothetical protein GN244_ATG10613 [Phytophthora infestans]KAF4038217.1 hypothetical protein GN244_ATG09668 [Phytophthora infestans]KAF4142708.1 hypothetical protein GN958_ATG08100 [Phytophthora infestans]
MRTEEVAHFAICSALAMPSRSTATLSPPSFVSWKMLAPEATRKPLPKPTVSSLTILARGYVAIVPSLMLCEFHPV